MCQPFTYVLDEIQALRLPVKSLSIIAGGGFTIQEVFKIEYITKTPLICISGTILNEKRIWEKGLCVPSFPWAGTQHDKQQDFLVLILPRPPHSTHNPLWSTCFNCPLLITVFTNVTFNMAVKDVDDTNTVLSKHLYAQRNYGKNTSHCLSYFCLYML